MKFAKKLVVCSLLWIACFCAAGCGVGTTQAENRRTINRVADYDARMLVDDLGLFAQINRPFRNSRWIMD